MKKDENSVLTVLEQEMYYALKGLLVDPNDSIARTEALRLIIKAENKGEEKAGNA